MVVIKYLESVNKRSRKFKLRPRNLNCTVWDPTGRECTKCVTSSIQLVIIFRALTENLCSVSNKSHPTYFQIKHPFCMDTSKTCKFVWLTREIRSFCEAAARTTWKRCETAWPEWTITCFGEGAWLISGVNSIIIGGHYNIFQVYKRYLNRKFLNPIPVMP